MEINNDKEMIEVLIKLKRSALVKCRTLLLLYFLTSILLFHVFPEIHQYCLLTIITILINTGLLFDCIVKEIRLHRLKEKLISFN
jgi:hypothetical protein